MKKRLHVSYNSPVVLTFVLLCVVVLIIDGLTVGRSTDLLFMTYHSSLTDPLTYLRFVSHVLGHGNWEHLMGNAAYLLLLGPMLEEKYGSEMLMEIIGITALTTGVVNYIFFPNIALCGASGIVFAFFTGFKAGEIPLTFILVALIYIGQQVLEGIFVTDNVSNMAHIVGGAVGAIIGYMLNKKTKYSRY